MKVMKMLAALVLLAGPHGACAGWHAGRITQLNFGYDGSTVTFVIEGWGRSNCTCYPRWPNTMCLDRTRVTFKEEYAWLLKA